MGPEREVELIAHRGLHNQTGVRENSRRAVLDAFESDVDGIEVDVQLLGDGSLVLFHDDTVTEPGGTPRLLGTLSKAGFRDRIDYDPLFLEELLELDWRAKRVILECKPNRNHLSLVRRLLRTLPEDASSRPLTLSSYDWDVLGALRGRTDVSLAPVVTELTGRARRQLKLDHWSELHLRASLLDSPKARDLTEKRAVLAWTVNDPNRFEELERLGIKGIMTDNPSDFEV